MNAYDNGLDQKLSPSVRMRQCNMRRQRYSRAIMRKTIKGEQGCFESQEQAHQGLHYDVPVKDFNTSMDLTSSRSHSLSPGWRNDYDSMKRAFWYSLCYRRIIRKKGLCAYEVRIYSQIIREVRVLSTIPLSSTLSGNPAILIYQSSVPILIIPFRSCCLFEERTELIDSNQQSTN